MSIYLLLDLAVLAGPLALSFDRRVRFTRSWARAAGAAAMVGVPFAAWDRLMTVHGAWSFNPRFVMGPRLFSLPLEELLFFFVVPFACLFIHEVLAAYLPVRAAQRDRTRAGARLPWAAAALACGALAVLVLPRLYTSTILSAAAAFFIYCAILQPALLWRGLFWLSLLVTYAPFLLVDGVLTALPVVEYAPTAILGPRLASIPVEDFLYSFTLLGFTLAAFTALPRRR